MALASLCMALFGNFSSAQTMITVAAASDLKFALEEVATQFEKNTGFKLRLIFGSSGNFYSQILQGAPFHIFMSADENLIFKLADSAHTTDRGKLYAFGRIGLMTPKGSIIELDPELSGLRKAVENGQIKRFALANPAHAPYGMRAKEALERAGLWDRLEPFLVFGENVSQAAQFAISGSTQGGIIAYSLAIAPQVAQRGNFVLIPDSWHAPLAQRMVILRGAPDAAKSFYEYLSTPDAQSIMMKYGFIMPKE